MGFGGVLSPISFAAERNGASGGKYAEVLKPTGFRQPCIKKRESLRWSKALFHYSLPSGILAIIVLYTCRKNSSVRVSENTSAMG